MVPPAFGVRRIRLSRTPGIIGGVRPESVTGPERTASTPVTDDVDVTADADMLLTTVECGEPRKGSQ
jgi:hypothetical protein